MVVGAGFGGIAAGVKMKGAGIHTFTIYESSLGIGGTWWDNTYPGAEVDVGSHLYSYSFKPHDWTRTHAKQAELQKYLEETVDEYGLRPHLRLGVAVESAPWDDDRHRVDGPSRRRHHRRMPRAHQRRGVPERPPLSRLAGARRLRGPEVPHLAVGTPPRPDRQVVAVVGTGSTATQIVPGHPARRAAPVPVPARAGLGDAQGRSRLHRRGAQDLLEPVAAQAGAPPAEVAAGEEHLGRQDLPGRHEGERGCAPSSASTTSRGPSTTAPTCARPSPRRTPTRASGRSSPRRSIRRSRSPTSSWCRRRSRR